MGHVLAIRSERESFFSQGPFSNMPLFAAVALTFALQMATIYVPFLNPIFKNGSSDSRRTGHFTGTFDDRFSGCRVGESIQRRKSQASRPVAD